MRIRDENGRGGEKGIPLPFPFVFPEKSSFSGLCLSAAQPTDQGEENVVLLLLVVVVVGGTIFQSPMYSFLGCEKAKTLSQKGCDKAKTLSKILFSTPQIIESNPFLFLYANKVDLVEVFNFFFLPPPPLQFRRKRSFALTTAADSGGGGGGNSSLHLCTYKAVGFSFHPIP